MRAHAVNQLPQPPYVRPRIALYRDFGRGVGEPKEMIALPAHSVRSWEVQALAKAQAPRPACAPPGQVP